ncbi:hypothetical protein GPECTOR_40g586 [Gonium pectorale]|uniref:Uncharacterized protein n=1 Tax=Gonium pectorale TaxID=33097 RepID=A0A150GAI0_GONPE|nr:hypothetical protein GPECTOR_40g586 [Gonium pectorale]|eukprot:KXZ46852.1 hypothetical protein GPECTOR_40g586 [Gonium pectorale]
MPTGAGQLKPEQEPELSEDEEEVDELIEDAAGFICVMDQLRPLDPASYNAFHEVWTRIARIPAGERYR